jgi:hypothetical protein
MDPPMFPAFLKYLNLQKPIHSKIMKALQFVYFVAITFFTPLPLDLSFKVIAAEQPTGRIPSSIESEQPTVSPPKKNTAEPTIGLLFESKSLPGGTDSEDTIYLIGTNYVGECSAIDQPEGVARFFSKKTKPADGVRVIVRNITFGFAGNQKPHTDREYYNGDVSEGFLVKFGTSHSGRYLAVQLGDNKFDYVIKNGDEIIENGEFSIKIDKKVSTVERNAFLYSEPYYTTDSEGRSILNSRTEKRCR